MLVSGIAVADCAGECGGSAVLDECDVCDGNGAFLIFVIVMVIF